MIAPNQKEYVKLAESHDLIPVYREILVDMETPVSVLQRFADRDNVFLLESMEGGEKWARYSYLGVDCEPFLAAEHASGRTGELEAVRNIYKNVRVAKVDGLPRFFGGAVGFFAYESMCEFERMPAPKESRAGIPLQSHFVTVNKLIVFDNIKHTAKIVVSSRPGDDPGVAYARASSQIEEIEAVLRSHKPNAEVAQYDVSEFESNMDHDDFIEIVKKAKDYIYAGDIIQVVLSQRFTARSSVPPVQLYRALRWMNPSPYTFFLKIGEQTMIGSSPEVMVRLTGNRVELRPIAGTRPRGQGDAEDRELELDLLADEKEKAEHVMLVDLGRNDLGRIAETGSVKVTDYMVIERYSHVMHMVSHVESVLRDGFDAYDVIKATFPAGTLTGAPKIRAMEIINELEPGPRGVYGGAVGYIGYDGNMDLAITIRTLVASGETVSVQAGAGIVFDSDPEKEFDETCHKARGMQKALKMAACGLELEQ